MGKYNGKTLHRADAMVEKPTLHKHDLLKYMRQQYRNSEVFRNCCLIYFNKSIENGYVFCILTGFGRVSLVYSLQHRFLWIFVVK